MRSNVFNTLIQHRDEWARIPCRGKENIKAFFVSLSLIRFLFFSDSLRFAGQLMQPKNIKSHIFQMLGFLVVYEWLCPVIHTQRDREKDWGWVWHRYALGIHLLQDNSPGQSYVIIFFSVCETLIAWKKLHDEKRKFYVVLSCLTLCLGSLASFRCRCFAGRWII